MHLHATRCEEKADSGDFQGPARAKPYKTKETSISKTSFCCMIMIPTLRRDLFFVGGSRRFTPRPGSADIEHGPLN